MTNQPHDVNSSAVQVHLEVTQSVIARMAANSTSAKTWCITLVSAILVIVADKGKPDYAWLAFLPTFLFAALDTYYLALEKGFRESYEGFIKKLHANKLVPEDLFQVKPQGSFPKHLLKAALSFSIWPFYAVLVGMVLIAKLKVL